MLCRLNACRIIRVIRVITAYFGIFTDNWLRVNGSRIRIGSKNKMNCGSTRGDKLDKYDHFKIPTFDDEHTRGLIPVDSAAWLQCRVENTQSIGGYRLITGRVEAQEDLNRPPLIWRQDSFFRLAPV